MRLILPLGLSAAILLLTAVVLGYSGSLLGGAIAHVYVSLAAVLGVLFSQSVLVVYFLGISRRVGQVARRRSPARRALAERPLPRSPVPLASAAIATTMAAFVLGGGAHTGAVSPTLHGIVALLAAAAQTASTVQERRAFREVERTVRAMEERAGELD